VKVNPKAKAAAPAAADTNDPFLLEAVQLFQTGKIDETTLLTLLKARKTEPQT
jgi:hypothetical protein